MERSYVAVDLGAGSGRVIVGRFGARELHVEVLHRFANEPRTVDGHERWNVEALLDGIKEGLSRVPSPRAIASIGVDAWGVDYALIDRHGRLLEDPVCYRDARTEGMVERVLGLISRSDLFRVAGLQTLPFNTLYQIVAHRHAGEWPDGAARLLMIPDVFHFLLCGSTVSEATIASTTELLAAETRQWAPELFEALDLPLAVMPTLVSSGTRLGELTSTLQRELDLPAMPIVAPASHDTASAVVGAPLEPGWAYLSSGTWSLLGVETPEPHLTEAVERERLTNEAGAEGTNRLLRNIMGLWILESCRAVWASRGEPIDHVTLMARLKEVEPFQAFIDPDDPRFFHPADMVEEIQAFLLETGQPVPLDRLGIARVVLESLALRYASVVRRIESVTGQPILGLRIIGGGSQNRFLNQATSSAANLEVRSGPVEATALGNLMVQAIADARFGSVATARRYIVEQVADERFVPGDPDGWAEARRRYTALESTD